MKSLLIITLWASLCASAWGQTKPNDPFRTGPAIGAFVDRAAWTALQSTAGDLNGDGRADVVVVLERKRASATTQDYERNRALLIVFAKADGHWSQHALAQGILPCASCLGTLSAESGPDVFDLDIVDGALLLGWVVGGDALKSVRLTFTYDPETRTMRLARDETVTFDPKRRTKTRLANDYVTGRREVDDRSFGAATRFIPIQQVLASQY